jgi:hypothetical protein
MWVEIKRVAGLKQAEECKKLFEDEGVPTRILPASGGEAAGQKSTTYRVLVPGDKEHIIKEVLKRQ